MFFKDAANIFRIMIVHKCTDLEKISLQMELLDFPKCSYKPIPSIMCKIATYSLAKHPQTVNERHPCLTVDPKPSSYKLGLSNRKF